MKYLIILALTCMSAAVQAQDSTLPYRYSAKVYANITREKDKQPNFNFSQTIIRPSFAFQIINSKGKVHEFELTDFNFNATKSASPYNVPNTYKVRSTSIALKYEYIISILKRKHYRLAPSLGLAIAPFYNHLRVMPKGSSAYFPTSNTVLGFRGLLTPRVTYNITKRLYADVNVPLYVLDMSHTQHKMMDPTLPAAQRTNGLTSFNLFSDGFNARIGLGIRF